MTDPAAATPAPWTTGSLARRLAADGHRTPDGRPVRGWMVRRVFELGHLPEPACRVGRYRLIPPAAVPAVVAALAAAGYLPADPRPAA